MKRPTPSFYNLTWRWHFVGAAAREAAFGVPPLRHDLPRWKAAVVIMLLLGAAFPLVGASLLLIWALDRLLLSRLGAPRRLASA